MRNCSCVNTQARRCVVRGCGFWAHLCVFVRWDPPFCCILNIHPALLSRERGRVVAVHSCGVNVYCMRTSLQKCQCVCVFDSIVCVCVLEPSRGPLQGPQARQEAESHRSPEEPAAANRGGLVRGERERQRQGARSGPEQELQGPGGVPRPHGRRLGGRIRYVASLLCGPLSSASPPSPLPFRASTPPWLLLSESHSDNGLVQRRIRG